MDGLGDARWAPINHHNLSYLPYPFLAKHMTLAARTRPMEVLEVADACLKSPGNALLGWPWVLAALAHAEEAAADAAKATAAAQEREHGEGPPEAP